MTRKKEARGSLLISTEFIFLVEIRGRKFI